MKVLCTGHLSTPTDLRVFLLVYKAFNGLVSENRSDLSKANSSPVYSLWLILYLSSHTHSFAIITWYILSLHICILCVIFHSIAYFAFQVFLTSIHLLSVSILFFFTPFLFYYCLILLLYIFLLLPLVFPH